MGAPLESVSEQVVQVLQTLSPERRHQVLDFARFIAHCEAQAAPSAAASRESAARPDMERVREHEWLRTHAAEYVGQWVALEGDQLVCSGPDGRKVFEAARRAGIEVPFVVQVEDPDAPPFGGW